MVKNQDLLSPGVHYESLNYENFWDWFVQITPLEHHWKYEPTYVLAQAVFLLGGLLTFLHALANGGRLIYLWFGILGHGLVVEMMSYFVPNIDNFWHSQTPVIFLGHRLPLHILFLYPCFLYQASIAVAKLNLKRWAEPFAVGLCTVLVDIPYDIISINYLHWTWHDTDPNIADRHYWVPWNSYYFHICFAASFTFWFHFTRKIICKNSTHKWQSDSVPKEILCTIISALLGMPGGVLLFLPNYHPLHDIYKLHSEVTFFIIFTVFLTIAWTGDRMARMTNVPSIKYKMSKSTWLLLLHLVLHYLCFWAIPIFFKSEDEVAIGLKEPIGPCNEMKPVQTAFGMTLQKRKYLCVDDYDEKYFDFHCLKGAKPPPAGSYWYTACGTPLPNLVEYYTIITIICFLASMVYGNLHFNSFGDSVFEANNKDGSQKKKKV